MWFVRGLRGAPAVQLIPKPLAIPLRLSGYLELPPPCQRK